jgi:4-hydroxy-2-oxoheptanedioate aldolase
MAYVFQSPGGEPATERVSLRQKLRSGATIHGGACYLGSAIVAEMMARIGLDFIYIDMQHGLGGYDTMLDLLRAVDHTATSPIVRVQSNDAGLIGQALDAGADGVIVPMVNTRADAERAVAACRYAPLGARSFGPLRVSITRGGDVAAANDRVLCLVMIENAEGVANADEIASVPGVDGIYIGQADLAVSLGLSPVLRAQAGTHEQAIARILAAGQANGIAVGLSGDPRAARDAGFRIITTGSDHGFVTTGLQALQDKLRAATQQGE